jgi:hypothetical protein
MKFQAARLAAVFCVFAGAPAVAEQPVAEPAAEASAVAQQAKAEPGSETREQRPDNDALLRAQAAGYKLVNKDGKELFCKKEMVTGSRLATRTRCLTLAQLEEQRNATKDMLMDMSRRSVNRPEEGGN